MKLIIIFQALFTILGSLLLAHFAALPQALSYAAGSGLIFLTFVLLAWGWSLIFSKKMIALAIGIIVFKYAILGIIIYTLVKLSWFTPLWFALGVASFAISALIYAIREGLKEGNDNVI
ncbi:hypothetical protein [Bdellovibrio sp. HCB2-146]|uniref:hypothetical protein n=1 Tax=Bdellovibrio sp. HCB2-146 TaxID=3394362 RepID=UPI0039BC62D4